MDYIAFGEVLFEEHSSSFSSPYLFNGKELDRETNLSYFGARYLDSKTSLWLNVDPAAEEYANVGSYLFCVNNPLNAVDPDGRRVYFVAGAGNDPASQGWNYRKRFKKIWEAKGIKDVKLMNVSHGKMGDMMFADAYRHYSKIKGSDTKISSKMIDKAPAPARILSCGVKRIDKG